MRDQTVIDDAKSKIDAARAELATAERKFHRMFNAQQKRIKAEMAKEMMTLELALTENFGDHAISNEAGYKWLQARCWNGEWKGLGLSVSGTWIHLNQRVPQLMLKRVMSDADLKRLRGVLEDEILPVLKPSGLYDASGLLGRPRKEFEQFADAKVINLLTEDCGENHSYKLLIRADGEAQLWDVRDLCYSFTQERAMRCAGSLQAVLEHIRVHAYYEVG